MQQLVNQQIVEPHNPGVAHRSETDAAVHLLSYFTDLHPDSILLNIDGVRIHMAALGLHCLTQEGERPREPQEAPQTAQGGPESPNDGPRTLKMAPRRPKRPPERLQKPPRAPPKRAPRRTNIFYFP
eukprot:2491671-Pyramimonas_sp.AAC.1